MSGDSYISLLFINIICFLATSYFHCEMGVAKFLCNFFPKKFADSNLYITFVV